MILKCCRETEMMSFNLAASHLSVIDSLWGAVPAVLLAMLALKKIAPAILSMALAPLILTVVLFLFSVNIFSTILLTFILALTVARLWLVVPGCKIKKVPERFWQLALIVVTAAFIIQGIYIHIEAWNRQFMLFPDWGLFTEIAYNTIQGNYFHTYWHGDVSFMGDHFEPGFFAVFIPLIWLFPSPYTTIFLGTLLLWGSALLIYKFSRTRKIPPVWSFCLALIYLCFPAVSNMNLSMFYGFHPDYMFIPVFILFAMAFEARKYRLALLIFLYSLTLKETNGAFWFGWGLCQIVGGKRKWGVIYALTGLFYFLICMKLVIPFFRGSQTNYQYLPDYAPLGNGIIEIALSPFLRPEVFWGTLCSIHNLTFLFLLILPVFMLAFNRFILIFSGFVILVFLFLRGNPDAVNLNFWYQTENMVMLNVVAVLGLIAVLRGREGGKVICFKAVPTLWSGIVMYGLASKCNKRKVAGAMLTGCLCAAGFSHYFYARSYYGCYSYEAILRKPDCSTVVNEIKRIIPSGSGISTDARCGSHFIIRNKVWSLKGKLQDWVLYDLGDSLVVPFSFHLDMLNNNDYGLVWMKFYKGHQYYLFKYKAKPRFMSPLQDIPDRVWKAMSGQVSLPPEMAKCFDVRGQFQRKGGVIGIICNTMVKRKLDKQYDVLLTAVNGIDKYHWKIPFGYGICPGQMASPGKVFTLKLALPPEWRQLQSVNVSLVPRSK